MHAACQPSPVQYSSIAGHPLRSTISPVGKPVAYVLLEPASTTTHTPCTQQQPSVIIACSLTLTTAAHACAFFVTRLLAGAAAATLAPEYEAERSALLALKAQLDPPGVALACWSDETLP